jgi:signal transduction histidine kinase
MATHGSKDSHAQRERELEVLAESSRLLTSTLDLGEVLERLADITRSRLEVDVVRIWLLDEAGQALRLRAHRGVSHHELAIKDRLSAREGVTGWVLTHQKPLVLADVQQDARLQNRAWFEAEGLISLLCVPITLDDNPIGILACLSRRRREFTDADVAVAEALAAPAAAAVRNAAVYAAALERAREVETLSAIGETLTSTLDLQKVLDAIADSAATLIGAQRAVVFELDPTARLLRARAIRGIGIEPGLALRLGQGAAGTAALTLKPAWSHDVLEQPLPGYDEMHDQSGMLLGALILKYGYRGILAVPVVSRDTALGAVCIYWDEVHAPGEREIRVLSALARQAAIAMDNARLVGDLRRTLDELKATQETLVRGATLRAVGELAAGAAHHLNNLMAVVLGRAQLLLMRNPTPEEVPSLKTIERAAVDAADTVRRIQAFSKTGRGTESTRFDLNTVVQEGIEFTRSRWQDEAQVRGTPIEVLFEPGTVPEVSGRGAEIREVVTNVILNAVDALPTGGRIRIATSAEGGRALVTIIDSGTGMTEGTLRRAFEPFFTTKGVKRTGLGLAVAYGTVRRHGGQITLESAPDHGSMVSFWLPAAEEGEEVPMPAVPPEPDRVGRILIIDDEADVRELLTDVLTGRGHTVTVAAGGREGLARFEAGRYDLVLTDLGMPELNGWEVARVIKSARRDTPVLLLTGWADPVDPSEEGGVDGIVRKPFDLNRLAAVINSALAPRG